MHERRLGRVLIGGLAAALLVVASPRAVGAAVVQDLLEDPLQAARGLGWAVHPDQVGGTERFVEGPLTPPSGRGSLEMTAPTGADRALIFTVPKPSTGVDIGEISAAIAIPWAETTGSFSTFTTNAAEPAASSPALLLVGFQHFNAANPALSSEFTVLHLEGGFQTALSPAPAPNVWRTWTLNESAVVWQSNTQDGFCGIDAPCTFGAFASEYDTGAWGQIQVGMGTGLPPNSEGYVDNVQLANPEAIDGDEFAYVADFEIPAPENSTATIAAGAATATGGSVGITLNSSALAALGETEFTITFSGTSAASPAPVTVPAGETATQNFPLPFGTTQVTVQAQGVTLATVPITFEQPTTSTTSTTTTPATPTTSTTSTTAPPATTTPASTTPATATSGTGATSGTSSGSSKGVELSVTG